MYHLWLASRVPPYPGSQATIPISSIAIRSISNISSAMDTRVSMLNGIDGGIHYGKSKDIVVWTIMVNIRIELYAPTCFLILA